MLFAEKTVLQNGFSGEFSWIRVIFMISRKYYQQTRTCGAQTPKLLDLKYCAHNFILKQNVKLESHCSQLLGVKNTCFWAIYEIFTFVCNCRAIRGQLTTGVVCEEVFWQGPHCNYWIALKVKQKKFLKNDISTKSSIVMLKTPYMKENRWLNNDISLFSKERE